VKGGRQYCEAGVVFVGVVQYGIDADEQFQQ
jgi:hypothetical protein